MKQKKLNETTATTKEAEAV